MVGVLALALILVFSRSALGQCSRPTYLDEQTYDPPGGHFRIHYSTNEAEPNQNWVQPTDVDPADGIPDYVNRCADAFRTAWDRLVGATAFTFDPPPTDGSEGGGQDLLDVYLRNMAGNGLTHWCALGNVWMEFHLNISDDGFTFDKGIKITAAHEFFHCVQAAYDRNDETWIAEGTARFVEDVVFDHVNYYSQGGATTRADAQVFLQHPEWSLLVGDPGGTPSQREGAAVLFMKFFAEHYGSDGQGAPAYGDLDPNKVPVPPEIAAYDDNGVDAIKHLMVATRSADGVDAVRAALLSINGTLTFERAFLEWLQTNYLKDFGIRYGAGWADYLEDSTGNGYGSVPVTTVGSGIATGTLPAWAGRFYRIPLTTQTRTVGLDFDGDDDGLIFDRDKFGGIFILGARDLNHDGRLDSHNPIIAVPGLAGTNHYSINVPNEHYDCLIVGVAAGNDGGAYRLGVQLVTQFRLAGTYYVGNYETQQCGAGRSVGERLRVFFQIDQLGDQGTLTVAGYKASLVSCYLTVKFNDVPIEHHYFGSSCELDMIGKDVHQYLQTGLNTISLCTCDPCTTMAGDPGAVSFLVSSLTVDHNGLSAPYDLITATTEQAVYVAGTDTAHVTVLSKSSETTSSNLTLHARLRSNLAEQFDLGTEAFSLGSGSTHTSQFAWAVPRHMAPRSLALELTLEEGGVQVSSLSVPDLFTTRLSPTDVAIDNDGPPSVRLLAPNPVPFHDTVAIRVTTNTMLQGGRLTIVDVTGRLVCEMSLGNLGPGPRAIVWDGKASSGVRAAAGVYFCRVTYAGGQTAAKRLVLLE